MVRPHAMIPWALERLEKNMGAPLRRDPQGQPALEGGRIEVLTDDPAGLEARARELCPEVELID